MRDGSGARESGREPQRAWTAAEHHGQCRARILSASPTISNGAVEIDPMVEQNALVRATNPAHPMGRGPGKQRIQTYFTILAMRIRTLSRGMLSSLSPIRQPCAQSPLSGSGRVTAVTMRITGSRARPIDMTTIPEKPLLSPAGEVRPLIGNPTAAKKTGSLGDRRAEDRTVRGSRSCPPPRTRMAAQRLNSVRCTCARTVAPGRGALMSRSRV